MKILHRSLSMVLVLALVISFCSFGVSAEYKVPASIPVGEESLYDTESGVCLEMVNYADGILTLALKGTLSDELFAEGDVPGWMSVSSILTFDNTKLSIYGKQGSKEETYGANGETTGNATNVKYKPKASLFQAYDDGELMYDDNDNPVRYSMRVCQYFVSGDRTGYYISIDNNGNLPYDQQAGKEAELLTLTFKVADKPDGSKYSEAELETLFTRDTIRFANWDNTVDQGIMKEFCPPANIYAVEFNTPSELIRGCNPMGETKKLSHATNDRKYMQATVNYPGVDNVTPGSLTGDLVTETAVEYDVPKAIELTITQPTLLDTDGTPITIDGDKYKVHYSWDVSASAGEIANPGAIKVENGKVVIGEDLVKASVASDTAITVTVNASLEGTSIKLSDTFNITVAASEVASISGPSTVVRGQSESQVLKYDYKAVDQYGNLLETTWTLSSPDTSMHGFYENDTFVDSETVNGKNSVVVGFGYYSENTVYLRAGNERKKITVTDLMAAAGATMPTVQNFTYGDYSSFAQAVTAPATIALVDGYTASNPVIKVYPKSGSATETTKVAAGEYVVCVVYSTDFNGAEFTCAPLDLTVEQKTVTAATSTKVEKVYDGTTAYTESVTVYFEPEMDVVGDDEVYGIAGSVVFKDANAGTKKEYNITGITLAGADAANYKLGSTACWGKDGVITPAPLTVTAADSYTKITKEYDGTTAVPSGKITDAMFKVTGLVGSETVTVSYTDAAFDSKNVDATKVTASNISVDSTNYTVATNTTVEFDAEITAKSITPVLNAADKVADGTTDVLSYTVIFNGIVDGETLTEGTDYTVNVAFAGTAVGTEGVTGTIALKDTVAAKNYTLSTTALSDADAKIIDLSLAAQPTLKDNDFTYGDYTYGDLINLPALSGLIVGANNQTFDADSVSISINGAAGVALDTVKDQVVPVSTTSIVVIFHDDSAAINSDELALTVSAKKLTVTATGSITKTYDGDTTVDGTVTLNLTGKVGSDSVNADYTGLAYDDKNAGNSKTVTVSGITVDNANYTVDSTCTTTGVITPAPVTITYSGSSVTKVYDGTTAFDASDLTTDMFTVVGFVSGDTVSFGTEGAQSAVFNSKDVATADKVIVSGLEIFGEDAANYVLTGTTAEIPATITPKALEASATATNKVYDGNDTATADVALTGAISGDTVSASGYTAKFSDKKVGNGKTVTVTGITLTGADAANYTVASSCTATANITAKTVTVTAAPVEKSYDGNSKVVGGVSLTVNGLVGNDNVDATYIGASYNSKNVGTGKTVTVSGVGLGGADADNYYFADTSCTTTGTIKAIPVTVSYVGETVNKNYDGTTKFTGVFNESDFNFEGAVDGDKLSLSCADEDAIAFNSKNVAEATKLNVPDLALAGEDAANYTLTNTSLEIEAKINPVEITPALNASNKVADGTNAVKSYEVTFTGLVSGDSLTEGTDYTVSGLAFAGTAVGTKGVNGTIVLEDTVAAKNYTLSTTDLSDADAEIVDLYLAAEPTATKTFTYGAETYASAIELPSMEDLIVGTEAVDAVKFDIAAYDANGNKIFEKTGLTTLPTDYIDVAVKKVSITFYDAANNAVPAADITGFAVEALELDVVTGDVEKTYDGTVAFTGTTTVELVGVMSGDVVTVESWTIEFDDANAGEDKGYTIEVVLGGADKDNYTVASQWTDDAVINPKSVTVSYNGSDVTKVYDGTTAFDGSVFTTAEFPVDSFISGDDVSISAKSAAFDSKDVATATKVVVSGFEITGSDKANYVLTNTTVEIPATITPASITATLNVANKVWDGNDTAFSHTVSFEGLVNGETTTDYTVSGVKFSGTDAGSAATGTVTLADDSNYELTATTVTGKITKNTSAEVSFGTKTGSDGTVTFNVTVTVKDSKGNTVTVTYPEYTPSTTNPQSGDVITVTVDNDNYSAKDAAKLTYVGGVRVIFNCTDSELAALNDSTTVLDNLAAAFANDLSSTSGNDVHITVVVDVLNVEYDGDVIESLELAVTASKVVDSKGAVAMLTLADELVLTLNVPESVDKAYAKVEGSNGTEYIELVEGEEVLTLTIESKNILGENPYTIEFTDDDGKSDEGVIVGPAVMVYTTAKPGGIVYPEIKYVAKGGSTYIAIAPNPGNVIDTIKINGVAVNYKDMLVGPNDAGLYHLRLTNLNRDTFVEISFKLKGQYVWSNPFTDVKITDWFYSSVEFACTHGLFNGTGATTFGPDEYMTRAMLVTVLHRLEGGPIMYSKSSFKDVPVGKYYTDAVAWASAVGIVTGNTDGTFNPDGLVTREQMAAILWRYAKYKGYDVSIGEETNILSYDDVFSVSEYAIPAMQWACGTGIINGVTPSTLQPKSNASRAVVATILMRFCNYYLV